MPDIECPLVEEWGKFGLEPLRVMLASTRCPAYRVHDNPGYRPYLEKVLASPVWVSTGEAWELSRSIAMATSTSPPLVRL